MNLKQEMLDTTWKAMQSGRHLDPDGLAQGHSLLFACLSPSIVSDFLEGKDISSISTSLLPIVGAQWMFVEWILQSEFQFGLSFSDGDRVWQRLSPWPLGFDLELFSTRLWFWASQFIFTLPSFSKNLAKSVYWEHSTLCIYHPRYLKKFLILHHSPHDVWSPWPAFSKNHVSSV